MNILSYSVASEQYCCQFCFMQFTQFPLLIVIDLNGIATNECYDQ